MILDVNALTTKMLHLSSSHDDLFSITRKWAEDWNSYQRRENTGYFFSIHFFIDRSYTGRLASKN